MKRIAILFITLLLLIPAPVFADEATGRTGVLSCAYDVPEDAVSYVSNLSDGDPFTTVTLYRGETLSVKLTDAAPVSLYFDFYRIGRSFDLLYLDAEGTVLKRQEFRPASYHLLLPIEIEGAAEILLAPTEKELVLSELHLCSDAFVPYFPETDAHADVLVIVDRPGDELELFGGLIAQLAGEHGLSVQIVYLTQTPGFEAHQCMEILKAMGVTREPVFDSVRPFDTGSIKTARNLIGGKNAELRYAQLIRETTPSLILTLDPQPNDAHVMRAVIAETVMHAAALAADETVSEGIPPHTVHKLYTLSEDGETILSLDDPLYAFDGETTDALADRLYRFYTEKRVYRRTMPRAVSLTLQASSVGEDEQKNDLLEHLSTDAFRDYRVPTPSTSPSPTPAPAQNPTAAPIAEATAKQTVAQTATTTDAPAAEPDPVRSTNDRRICYLPLGIGIALSVATVGLLQKKESRIKLFALLPLLLGIVLTVLALTNVLPMGRGETPVAEVPTPAEAMTPEPTGQPTVAPSPTPEPTEPPTPSPEPTEEPTPTPDPNDAYYLAGDGEEFELDFDNGHWWYKNSVLAIDVKEVHTEYTSGKPLVYYVADIRMRDYSSFRVGLRDTYTAPWKFARYDGAVLAVTGDCLDNEKESKGCLIRNGVYYCDLKSADVLTIEQEGMSMRVMPAADANARVLMDNGVRNAYSFGPILVENGEISSSLTRHRVAHVNPRAGIGMVEPGHWVAIVSDGRQPGYSMSISLEFFAQMFIDYGCTVAFNMDGGSSCGIVFMGEMLNRHEAPDTTDLQRPWIDALEFGYSTQLPSPDQSTKHNGYHY